jgi:hypothetical protein
MTCGSSHRRTSSGKRGWCPGGSHGGRVPRIWRRPARSTAAVRRCCAQVRAVGLGEELGERTLHEWTKLRAAVNTGSRPVMFRGRDPHGPFFSSAWPAGRSVPRFAHRLPRRKSLAGWARQLVKRCPPCTAMIPTRRAHKMAWTTNGMFQKTGSSSLPQFSQLPGALSCVTREAFLRRLQLCFL